MLLDMTHFNLEENLTIFNYYWFHIDHNSLNILCFQLWLNLEKWRVMATLTLAHLTLAFAMLLLYSLSIGKQGLHLQAVLMLIGRTYHPSLLPTKSSLLCSDFFVGHTSASSQVRVLFKSTSEGFLNFLAEHCWNYLVCKKNPEYELNFSYHHSKVS